MRIFGARFRLSGHEGILIAGRLLPPVLFDVADESQHRRYAGRGAEPARPRPTEPSGPRLRRRALRRGRPRLPRLLRPEDGGAGRKRTRVRRLPHGHRQFPALPRERRGEVQAACSCSGGSIPTPTIRCFGRSTRTISAPMATVPAISAICGRTVSSGSLFRCRRI